MRISSPPVKFPCLFGINRPTSKHLIGAQQSVEDLRKSLGLDSLAYLDLPLLEQAVSDYNQGYCTACFDGNYPMDIHKCKNCVSILKKIKKGAPKMNDTYQSPFNARYASAEMQPSLLPGYAVYHLAQAVGRFGGV